jgi:hypothetical protein
MTSDVINKGDTFGKVHSRAGQTLKYERKLRERQVNKEHLGASISIWLTQELFFKGIKIAGDGQYRFESTRGNS